MKKTRLFFLTFVLLCGILWCSPIPAIADVGDFSGDSDYGWDSSDYDYDYSWDDDDYDYSWSWDDDDDDYSYSSGYSSGSGSSDFDMSERSKTILGGIIFFGGIAIFIGCKAKKAADSKKYKTGTQAKPVIPGATETPDSELKPISEYMSLDPGFNERAFTEMCTNLYVRMQNAWTTGDFTPMQPYFTDALFKQLSAQLKAKTDKGHTNYVERISVLDSTLRGFKQVGNEDHMIVRLRTRIVDYTEDRDGKLISGSRDREKFMTYEWEIARTSGHVTVKKDGVSKSICPSCGAPIDLNASTRCEYCGSIVSSGDFDWAICSMKGVAQRTL